MAALAGANLIYGLGMIESGMNFDFGQLIMDDEFVRMIKHTVGGIPVNDETLSVDITKGVGPFSDFLSHENTYKYMRSQSQPKLINRVVRQRWEAAGKTDLHQRALAEAVNILENHKPAPLPEGVPEKLRKIVETAEAELGL